MTINEKFIKMIAFLVLTLFFISGCHDRSKHYYVDGDVTTSGDGSRSAPFRTIQKAAGVMEAGDVCHIKGGTYRETIRPARSGTLDAPLVFQPWGEEEVVVSGCKPVTGWRSSGQNIYSTDLSLNLGHHNQVFAGGDMMFEARWPNAGGTDPEYLLEFKMATMDEGTEPTRIMDDSLPQIDWSGARVWVSSYKRWFCWTGEVKGSGNGYLYVENNADDKGNQECRKGGKYYVFGAKALLDTANEYYYDPSSDSLYVWMPDGGKPGSQVEIKVRQHAFDLRGVSNLVLKNLHIFGADIITGEDSRNVTLDGLRAKYVYHSSRAINQYGSQRNTGIKLEGKGHTVKNCEIAYSSGSCISLSGKSMHIINNYIHDGDYIGSYAAPVEFNKGCLECVVSHNTIKRSGRTIVSVSGFYASLLQYNDLSHAGYLSDDLGLTYGNGVEGGNSEVRYNWLHDNLAGSHNMGLYFDHGCKNVIYHHNVIWGAVTGMINNQYGNYLLYYNNTVADAQYSYRSTWAAAQKKDLYGCRMFNNVGPSTPEVEASGLEMGSNSWNYRQLQDKKYPAPGTEPVNSGKVISGITVDYSGSAPDRGAYELGGEKWEPGHDFDNPPREIDTSWSCPPHRNLVRNAAFYRGDMTPWEKKGPDVTIFENHHGQWTTDARAMMGGYSVRLGEGQNGLHQKVTELKPDSTYEFMAKFRVPEDEKARLSVKDHGRPSRHGTPIKGNAPHWKMSKLKFTTGKDHTSATIILEKISTGNGRVYVDDPGLRLVPDN